MVQSSLFKNVLFCCFFSFSLNGATRTVLNLLDNGSPGSLRETIASADSGDTIIFAPSGTIFLDNTKGELVIDKSLTIDGEGKIVIDGQNKIDTCLHVLSGNYDVTFLSLTIQHFSDEYLSNGGTSNSVCGILSEDKVSKCTVCNCIIQKLTSTSLDGGVVYGILLIADVITVTGNSITELVRGTEIGYTGGKVVGIRPIVSKTVHCSDNTISYCSSGDSEQVSGSVFGIRVLEENTAQKGDCLRNAVHHCWSGGAVEKSGAIGGIRARLPHGELFFSGNQVSYCWSGSAEESGPVSPMSCSFIRGVVSRNRISDCQSGDGSQASGDVAGMNVGGGEGVVFDNVIESLTTGSAGRDSGFTIGIELSVLIPVDGALLCKNNRVQNLSTGKAQESGAAIGISNQRAVCPLNGQPIDIVQNFMVDLHSGAAFIRGSVIGIIESPACDNSQVSCNTINNLSGGRGGKIRSDEAGGTRGILLSNANNLTVLGNVISEVIGDDGAFTAGIQLGGFTSNETEGSIINSAVFSNTIKNINNATTGYGIAVLTEGSYGNSLLSNSISDTSGKAISITDNIIEGQDLSAIADAVVTLSTVSCAGGKKIRVTGVVAPQAGMNGNPFLLQFFVSDSSLPSQAKTLIFEYALDPSAGNTFDLTFIPAVPTSSGQYISTTATAQVEPPVHNWNTSEVSNGVPACNSTGAPYLKLVCPEKSQSPAPFDCNLFVNCSLDVGSSDANDIL